MFGKLLSDFSQEDYSVDMALFLALVDGLSEGVSTLYRSETLEFCELSLYLNTTYLLRFNSRTVFVSPLFLHPPETTGVGVGEIVHESASSVTYMVQGVSDESLEVDPFKGVSFDELDSFESGFVGEPWEWPEM